MKRTDSSQGSIGMAGNYLKFSKINDVNQRVSVSMQGPFFVEGLNEAI